MFQFVSLISGYFMARLLTSTGRRHSPPACTKDTL